jgi:EAL domain-containing protein (putative c-di-GMP-specific phosphodiesterase class I)
VEALVRWRHPQRGVLGPDLFIPIAEKTGIIVKIGHWVLLTACRQAAAWLNAGFPPLRMAVNVSALQLKSHINFEYDVAATLAETRLPPHLLELELTETVLMNASQQNSGILAQLRNLGVTVAIDDFGTGFSSLDYLHRMPADRLKIAQTFVRHLESTPGNATIIRATIGLAQELGMMVIAEGVETRNEFEMLKSWGCAEVQGYYFAKPLNADEIVSLMCNPQALQIEQTANEEPRQAPILK